ncbi:hypothetical protein JCM8097_004470 [Rhodosporidiobolus ruineniae]
MSVEGTPASDLGDVWGPLAPPGLAAKLCGPFMAGYLGQLVFSCLFIGQSHTFLTDHSHPRKTARKVLLALVALNVVYGAFMIEEAYTLGVRQQRDVASLLEATQQWNVIPPLAGVVGATAQTFLTLRAGAFIKHTVLRRTFFVWQALLIVNSMIWSIWTGVMGGIIISSGGDPNISLPVGWNVAVAIYLSSVAALDIGISVVLGCTLRSRIAGFSESTDSVLKQLIWLGARTAAFTAILTIPGAVLAGLYTVSDVSDTNITGALWLPLPALHSLAFLYTISTTQRAITTGLGSGGGAGKGARTAGGGRGRSPGPGGTRSVSPGVVGGASGIQIVVQTDVDFDDDDEADSSGGETKHGIGLRPVPSAPRRGLSSEMSSSRAGREEYV